MNDQVEEEEGIKPVLMKVKLYNNWMLTKRHDLGLSQKEMAAEIGVALQYWGGLESLAIKPFILAKSKKKGNRLIWRKMAMHIATYFQVEPEVIWPEAVLKIEKSTITRALSSHDILSLPVLTPQYLLAQGDVEQQVSDSELRGTLKNLVKDVLDWREKMIITARFNLDGKGERTLKEAADEYTKEAQRRVKKGKRTRGMPSVYTESVGQERARQIELKALRKLRHVSRSKHLKPFFEV